MTLRPDSSAPPAAPAPLVRAASPPRPLGAFYLRFWFTFGALFAADQLSKLWVTRHILDPDNYSNPIPVIDGFFYFVNITNAGAAWGMFSGYSAWLGWLGVLALGAIFFFRRHLELHRPYLQYVFGLLCGGILGNLCDRVHYGHVVDFLDFYLPWGYRYPAFNVADSGITVGVILYLLYSFRDFKSSSRPPSS